MILDMPAAEFFTWLGGGFVIGVTASPYWWGYLARRIWLR